MKPFKLTSKQEEANKIVSSDSTHVMLFGGSRSGKTFLHVRNIILRALKAPRSRHAILRFRFNHIKSSIIYDTFPKVMDVAFKGIEYRLNKTDWFATLPNGSEIWFGGLDDKERTEKILGNEYVTIYLNECSQISYEAVSMVVTRLAQKIQVEVRGMESNTPLKPRIFYDCNPPTKGHWTYKLFVKKVDPESKAPLPNPEKYAHFQMNPKDNQDNLSDDYLNTLESLSERLKRRFLYGEFTEDNPNALFKEEYFYKWKADKTPDMVRIVVSVDPSGASDDSSESDAIGIVVVGLGVDGNCYVIEDCTITADPSVWGKVAVSAYDRHEADVIVAETNYGGGMVKYVIKSQNANIPYVEVSASRGKHVRAEPISVLYEQGKVRHTGDLSKLEDELLEFSTHGYLGSKSPNRADALIWGITALFPRVVNNKDKVTTVKPIPVNNRW